MIHANQISGLKAFLKDNRKKSFPIILKELFSLWYIKGEFPKYYFKYLYKRGVYGVENYLSTKQALKIHKSKKLHNKTYLALMKNKLMFSHFCSINNLPSPKVVSHNCGRRFYHEGTCVKVSNLEEAILYFENVFRESGQNRLFLKPFSMFGGRGACILNQKSLKQNLIENLDMVVNEDYIHQEVIIQHEKINEINPHCINTLRIETYIDKKGEINIMNAFMRFGTGTKIVDNGHSGGIYVGIDLSNGTLKDTALQEIHFGADEFVNHPTTNFLFKGFKVPYFKEACELALNATEFIPNRYIGWDIAIQNDGPVIVEANDFPDFFMSDTSYGGYLKNPLMVEVLEESTN